jgi:hypothetical protein
LDRGMAGGWMARVNPASANTWFTDT